MIDHVHSLDMDFGLWVEPEMVNPDSDLYRAHPDWVMSFPGRQRTQQRNQLVLNLAREDVKNYVFNTLDHLVSTNDIAFLKWDYNRNWSEPGWDGAADPQSIYFRYIKNLYDVLARLRARHPKLEIEDCSGGGGRVDLGILRYTDDVWPSDNTDALDRLNIQYGFTQGYAPRVMSAWVTDVPNFLDKRIIPLQFRFLVAMQGALGIGGDLNRWSGEELEQAKKLVAFYKQVRPLVQEGELYRLSDPRQNGPSQTEYVSSDRSRAVVFAYLPSQHLGFQYPTVRLEGLDLHGLYRVTSLTPEAYSGEPLVTGSLLMQVGIPLRLAGDYASTALTLEREIDKHNP